MKLGQIGEQSSLRGMETNLELKRRAEARKVYIIGKMETTERGTPAQCANRNNEQQQEGRNRNNKQQFPSILIFACVILLVNLCPFQEDFGQENNKSNEATTSNKWSDPTSSSNNSYSTHIESCLNFVKLMFSNPIRLGKRTVRYTQAEAKVLGKMAKVWYIKKKLKKFGKKLKKKTIAVPVFTAIPIYEHSYYPQPHVTHIQQHQQQHAAAASSYAPSVSALATPAASTQMATSASNSYPVAYKLAPSAVYQHMKRHRQRHPAAHQIINNYAPAPPTYVDPANGFYGHYGNAYGRYDGGYQLW